MLGLNWTRTVARTMVVGAGAVGLAMSAGSAVAQDAFAIGHVPGDVTSIGAKFAEVAGTFAKYNIKPELVKIDAGSRGVQVLLAGKLQAMQVGFSVAVNANREGADLRLISSSCNVMPMEIFVVPTVKSAADLKGQKIAVSSFASESDMAVSLALHHWKMTRKDVVVTQLGGMSQRLAAQLSGQVLAAPYVAPGTALAREKGFVSLVDLASEGEPWVFNGLIVNRDFMKAKPDLLKRFLKGYIEGVYRALSDEKWAKEVISKEWKTESKTVLDDTYALFKKVYPRDFTPTNAAVSNVIAEVNAIGPPLATKNVEDYVDLGPLAELKKEGFFDEMKKRYPAALR